MQSPSLASVLCACSEAIVVGRMRAVLFGGFALPAYGVERVTLDIDWMLCDEDLGIFAETVKPFGYREVLKTPQYAKLRAEATRLPDMDTVFVDSPAMAAIWQEAEHHEVGDVTLPFASLRLMFGTKLHALRYNETRRGHKRDLDDVVALLVANALRPEDAWFREICRKYGTGDLWEKICRAFNDLN